MRTIFALTIVVLFFSLPSTGQNLKKKLVENNLYRETYFIDKKTKLQSGSTFVIDQITKDTLATGQYKNGMRDSVWNYFENREKRMAYNFTSNQLEYLNSEALPDSFMISDGNNFVLQKVERPLLFLGFKYERYSHLSESLRLPLDLAEKGVAGSSIIKFQFDESGNLTGSSIVRSIDSGIDQQIIGAFNSFAGRFLPPVFQGKPVASALFVKVNVGPVEVLSKYTKTEKPYLIEIDFGYVGIQTTRIISGQFSTIQR
jgi:hypothetical protein